MTEEQTLIAAIISDPEDDTKRLAFADWCEENGDEWRAEFIRVQCAIAVRSKDDPELRKLKQQEHQCMQAIGSVRETEWIRWWNPHTGDLAPWSWFSRGFMTEVSTPWQILFTYIEDLLWHPCQGRPCPRTAHPVQVVSTTRPFAIPVAETSSDIEDRKEFWCLGEVVPDEEEQDRYGLWFDRGVFVAENEWALHRLLRKRYGPFKFEFSR